MIDVLVYPNITYARDLEKDSYIVLLGAILRRLADRRPDMEFTVLVPTTVHSLTLPNVTQVWWPQPTYPNTMRCHFDVRRFLDIVDWRTRSWDVVWSHLPEHTTQIKNALWNGTDERVPIVGYCHWFEVPPFHAMAADTFDLNLAGLSVMESCGVNSQWLKDHVLRQAEQRVSPGRLSDLDRILRPMHLGTERTIGPALTLWDEPTPEPERGLLVWNHRTDTYAGFPAVLRALDELWERRQDFRLLVTIDPHAARDRPYHADMPHGDRDAYFRRLAAGWVGLPRPNCQWSVAVTDGFSSGLPYVVPRDGCYPEMLPPEYPLFYDLDLAFNIGRALDMTDDERAVASGMVLEAAELLSWDRRVGAFADQLDEGVAASTPAWRSARYADLRPLAEAGATKRELKAAMGWGVGIPWTPYRARLRADGLAVTGSTYGAPQNAVSDAPSDARG